jgi:hypothetical protein
MEELVSRLLQNNFARMVSIFCFYSSANVGVYSVTESKALNIILSFFPAAVS